jgi:amino acid transporter
MKRKIYWSVALATVGLLIAQEQTYWLPGTYLLDIETCAIAIVGCAAAGFTLGCIVEATTTERQRRLKILYWLVVMAILGSFIAFGKGISVSATATRLAWTLAVGLVTGVLQYFFQRPKATI